MKNPFDIVHGTPEAILGLPRPSVGRLRLQTSPLVIHHIYLVLFFSDAQILILMTFEECLKNYFKCQLKTFKNNCFSQNFILIFISDSSKSKILNTLEFRWTLVPVWNFQTDISKFNCPGSKIWTVSFDFFLFWDAWMLGLTVHGWDIFSIEIFLSPVRATIYENHEFRSIIHLNKSGISSKKLDRMRL